MSAAGEPGAFTVATVSVGASPLGDEAGAVVGVVVSERLSCPASCEVVLAAPEKTTASVGDALAVTVGVTNTTLFSGEITAVGHEYGPDGAHLVRLRGYDLLHRLRKQQSVQRRDGTDLRALVENLAGGAGLQVAPGDGAEQWPDVGQVHASDLELVVRLAAMVGRYLVARDGIVHLVTLEGDGEAVEVGWGDELVEARIEVNGDRSCRSVEVTGWDPALVTATRGRAEGARIGRKVAAEAGGGALQRGGAVWRSDGLAESTARAELDRRAAGEVTLWGILRGDPRLRPGRPVKVAGIDADVAGTYVVTGAVHTVDGVTGYHTEITTEPPPPPTLPDAPVLALGAVIEVDDPDGLGRVRVRLGSHHDVETAWLHVVVPGAGPGKGIVALPDVDDQVVVALLDADPTAGLVLGGLHGAAGPPDDGVEGGRRQRFTVRTASGHTVVLDDDARTVRVEAGNGSKVELGPDHTTLHSSVDLTLEAPGHSMVLTADTIDFRRG